MVDLGVIAKNRCRYIWDPLGDLVPFIQFKKREERPCGSATFSKVVGISNKKVAL